MAMTKAEKQLVASKIIDSALMVKRETEVQLAERRVQYQEGQLEAANIHLADAIRRESGGGVK